MYTYRGKDISELRRAELRDVAAAIGVSGDGSKTDLLERLAVFAADNKLVDDNGIIELVAVEAKHDPVKAVAKPVAVKAERATFKHQPTKRKHSKRR